MNRKEILLKEKLDRHYNYFDFAQISPDPLEFPHRYTNHSDIEISSFISSVFAFGNVTQINKTLDKIHSAMNNQPHEFIKEYTFAKGLKIFAGFKHRFYTSRDISSLFSALENIYSGNGSIKQLFLLSYSENEPNLKNAISVFSGKFAAVISEQKILSPGQRFMIPDPAKGSACKRMNLFLRWMVRNDKLDFGLWREIRPSKLVIPVDTHVAKICKKINLTKRKNVSWNMAEEITGMLKKFDPEDPVKYDFAICHIGMRKLVF